MKTVAVCLVLALIGSLTLVSGVLFYWGLRERANSNYCRGEWAKLYEVALEQNNALNVCVGLAERCQEAEAELLECKGLDP